MQSVIEFQQSFPPLQELETERVWSALLDMHRSFDSDITNIVRRYQKQEAIHLDAQARKELRDLIYYDCLFQPSHHPIYSYFQQTFPFEKLSSQTQEAISHVQKQIKESNRIKEQIITSLHTRATYSDRTTLNEKYLAYLDTLEAGKAHFVIAHVDPHKMDDAANYQLIRNGYQQLANYHYMAIIFTESTATIWQQIAHMALYAEHFIQEPTFPLFQDKHRKQQIEKVMQDCQTRSYFHASQIEEALTTFYTSLSTGFQFVDLLIEEEGKRKVLLLQKIEYDSRNIRCPDCFDPSPRSNSYAKVGKRSFECTNPSCISRSKSGRGKRYTLLSAKRAIKRQMQSEYDVVPVSLLDKFRRDIFKTPSSLENALIRLYSFDRERITFLNEAPADWRQEEIGHRVLCSPFLASSRQARTMRSYDTLEELPIVHLFQQVKAALHFPNSRTFKLPKEACILVEADSTEYLAHVAAASINHAVTSPPYYNARHYSTWNSLLSYLFDMLAHISITHTVLKKNALYVYNIGDIVAQDNIFVGSSMSKRKQMLGFYSVLLFELVGFRLKGNRIWDKGEVQSKRNSSANRLPHYVKPINAYEHIFIFTKEVKPIDFIDRVDYFPPVIKVGKGRINRIGHTAPFPLEVVATLAQSTEIQATDRIMDAFLGSGTTAVWCLEQGINCLGIERQAEYIEIAKKRMESHKT